jgi:hypothetical protein
VVVFVAPRHIFDVAVRFSRDHIHLWTISKTWIVFLFHPKSSCTLVFFSASSLYTDYEVREIQTVTNPKVEQ